jgi:hypothetical protein
MGLHPRCAAKNFYCVEGCRAAACPWLAAVACSFFACSVVTWLCSMLMGVIQDQPTDSSCLDDACDSVKASHKGGALLCGLGCRSAAAGCLLYRLPTAPLHVIMTEAIPVVSCTCSVSASPSADPETQAGSPASTIYVHGGCTAQCRPRMVHAPSDCTALSDQTPPTGCQGHVFGWNRTSHAAHSSAAAHPTTQNDAELSSLTCSCRTSRSGTPCL